MTQAIAKYAAKKMLSSEMEKYKNKAPAGSYDPFYEEIPHPKKPGKFKKVKKQIPAYIPEHDANILARSRKTAYRLDCCLFNFLGIRFGWSSVIGLVPAAGDGMDMVLAGNLVRKMNKIEGGLPGKLWFLMALNVIIDFFVGLVPFVGDLADAAMRANSRNVRLLEKHLDKKYKPKEVEQAEDQEEERTGHRRRPATIYEDFSDEEMERAFAQHHAEREREEIRQPARAYSGRRDRIQDEEMGYGRREERPSRNDTHRSRDERPSRSDTHRSRDDRPSRHNTRGSRR